MLLKDKTVVIFGGSGARHGERKRADLSDRPAGG